MDACTDFAFVVQVIWIRLDGEVRARIGEEDFTDFYIVAAEDEL